MEQRSSSVAAIGFESFYERELARQVRGATLVLGSVAAAQDAVHDAFVEVFRRWPEISEPGPYLQRAVVNRCRDLLRRDTRARRHASLSAPPEGVPETDLPLYEALAALPFNHRTAVVLRYYLDLSEAEIAEHLGCARGSVGPWLRRGLDRLAIQLRLPEEDQ